MNSMHRQFGKLMNRGKGDSAKVSVLISDYDDADKMLTKMIEASTSWRDAWILILDVQLQQIFFFDELYRPIVGTIEGLSLGPVLTPQIQLDRTSKLKEIYAELKTDLLDEVCMMDARVIKPATDARDLIQPIRRTIKKRDNLRLDWERYNEKVSNILKKSKRSDREDAALAKAEEELSKAAALFEVADEHLQKTLPPIITATFSILPHLLSVQIMIQTTLLAHSYTALHNYCEEVGLQSPPPPMEEVISSFERDFKPIQQEVESINCIARGRAVHQSMALGNDASGRKNSLMTGLNIPNGFATRRDSSQPLTNSSPMRIPSSNSTPVSPPSPEPTQDYSPHLTPSYSNRSRSPGPGGDYVGQKKKPPPPPPKRSGSETPGLYVIALYAFAGEGPGDLNFQAGDRIRVVKKTDSADDWWEGILGGVRGSFPANYCKIG